VKHSFSKSSLSSCLNVSGPKRELWIASLGCLIGSTLLIIAIQFYQDTSSILKDREVPKNYFTLNKKVEGGALVNLGKNERTFTSDELDKIKALMASKGLVDLFVINSPSLCIFGRPEKSGWVQQPRPIFFLNPSPMSFSTSSPRIGIGMKTLKSSPSWFPNFI